MSQTEIITIRMPKEMIRILDHFVYLGLFPSRSEAIREGVRLLLQKMRNLMGVDHNAE